MSGTCGALQFYEAAVGGFILVGDLIFEKGAREEDLRPAFDPTYFTNRR